MKFQELLSGVSECLMEIYGSFRGPYRVFECFRNCDRVSGNFAGFTGTSRETQRRFMVQGALAHLQVHFRGLSGSFRRFKDSFKRILELCIGRFIEYSKQFQGYHGRLRGAAQVSLKHFKSP